MKTKTKTSKCIFSVFLAVLCTLGVFFVSYIPSLADSVYIVPFLSRDPSYSDILQNGTLLYSDRMGVRSQRSISVYCAFSSSGKFYFASYEPTTIYYSWPGLGSTVSRNTSSFTPWSFCYNFISGVSNPAPGVPVFSTDNEVLNYFESLFTATPTPDPTPTPAPTPTPTPDPGGTIPTPSGDYGSFFQRMASDAQSAFNALYLSWTNANNRFYSSIFFIGLPLLITVFGIVAGIILGDDD